MDLQRRMAETEARYRARREPREDQKRRLATGSILVVDKPERVQKRLERLAREPATARAIVTRPGPTPVTSPEPVPSTALALALERVLGRSDLMSITYLERGLLTARSVGRIRAREVGGRVIGYGTGFMISPRLLLTNNHVLPSAEDAARAEVEFNYQEGVDGQQLQSVVIALDPGAFYITDEQLDYTVVSLSATGPTDPSAQVFSWNRLIEEEGKVVLGEYLSIIQHPNGEPKQIALRENQLVDLLDDFAHYETDTAPGSSGSPVFNDQWEVVALHHSGVPKRDEQGRILTREGDVWTEEMGEQRIAWAANEGVRISRIVRSLRQADLPDSQRRLRDSIFESAVPPLPASLTPGSSLGGSVIARHGSAPTSAFGTPTISADGTAIWTIPLQIGVRLGQLAPPASDLVPSLPEVPAVPTPEDRTAETRDLREALLALEIGRVRTYYDVAKDRQDREAYYRDLTVDVSPVELFTGLSELITRTHVRTPSYKPMQRVYPWVDLHPDRKLRSVYSGKTFEPDEFIRADFETERRRESIRELMSARLATGQATGQELSTLELDLLEARLPFNCEHVVPQSWFGKREPMRGDLHHLFACEANCNSFRGNTPYFDFADFGEAERSECGRRVENRFEPESGKGAVARATLYFLLRYPGQINRTQKELEEDRVATLLDWHRRHEVTEYERHRNQAIFEEQGNRNPLVDYPEWAERIDFTRGLG